MKSKKVVTFGEIMMRLSTPGFSRFTQTDSFNVVYGGSEANVAVSLAGFGLNAEHVTRFPSNDFGKAAVQALRRNGVITDRIVFGEQRMGLYFLENGSMQRSSRIIYDRFDSAFANITPGMVDWDEIFKDTEWFHWTGITPAISEGAALVCLEALKAASKHGLKVSGDINYRRNLWQYGKSAREVMPELIGYTHHVVAGVADLENCLGITGSSFDETCSSAQKICPAIKSVSTTYRDSVSSSHNKLSAVSWSPKGVVKSQEYDLIPIVDRVGGGDAFMAGLIYGWISGKTNQQTIEFAIAASAWKHSIEGDVNLASVEEIDTLVKGENVGRLLR
jgi:2-dehydro-3-deoxygluconokinase